MCAARITKESPPRSAHSPGRASGVRSAGLDSSATDPPTETSSLLLTNRTSFRFHERLGLFQVYLLSSLAAVLCPDAFPNEIPKPDALLFLDRLIPQSHRDRFRSSYLFVRFWSLPTDNRLHKRLARQIVRIPLHILRHGHRLTLSTIRHLRHVTRTGHDAMVDQNLRHCGSFQLLGLVKQYSIRFRQYRCPFRPVDSYLRSFVRVTRDGGEAQRLSARITIGDLHIVIRLPPIFPIIDAPAAHHRLWHTTKDLVRESNVVRSQFCHQPQ